MKQNTLMAVALISLTACAKSQDIDLFQFTPADACKATLTMYYGTDPKTMEVDANDSRSKKSSVSYKRSDGKYFVYDCRISGDRLSFRTRQGSGVGKPDGMLSVDPKDGGVLTITLVKDGKTLEKRSFKRREL